MHLLACSIYDERNVVIVLLLELIHFMHQTWQVVYLNIGFNICVSVLNKISKKYALNV